MNITATHEVKIKNIDSPFTELFGLFQQYEMLTKMKNKAEIEIINQHLNNAIETLFQGLQSIGHLLGGHLQYSKSLPADIVNIGYFIALISNLAEALNILRLDANYALRGK